MIKKKLKADKDKDKESLKKDDSSGDDSNDIRKAILKLKKNINTQYKRPVVVMGAERGKYKIRRFSTDSFWVDYALGGGLPLGRFVMFWGEESTFKTGLALKAMADAQARNRDTHEYTGLERIYLDDKYETTFSDNGEVQYKEIESGKIVPDKPLLFTQSGDDAWELDPITAEYHNHETGAIIPTYRCAIIDIEGTHDDSWFEDLGGIKESIFYTAPDYGEQAVDIVQGIITSGMYDLIIIDSLAMIAPMDEVEKTSEKEYVGKQAKLLNHAFRKWTADINKLARKPTIILINQRREKITLFGNPDTTPGGKGQHFVTSVEVRTKSNRKILALDDDGKYPLYQEMAGIVNKNKTAPPKIGYTFNIAVNDYDPTSHAGDKKYPTSFRRGEILEHKDIITYASKYKLMGKTEDEKNFFIALPSLGIKELFKKKGDLLDQWIFQNRSNYKKVRSELLKVMTGCG